jgi:DNA-binding response OmpR family regulator
MRILIVEDDARIVSFLVKGLHAEGYVTETAADAQTAIQTLAGPDAKIDIVLLDLGLPAESGDTVLTWLRDRADRLPVIVLTARATTADKVHGLNLGANDYMTKPFSFEELLARIRAAARVTDQVTPTALTVGDLRFDALSKVAWRDGQRIDLRPKEWALLECFMRHPHHVLSRSQILSQVWDLSFDPGSNIVDVYVGYLRKKLNGPNQTPLIQTVRGAGYRFVPAPS